MTERSARWECPAKGWQGRGPAGGQTHMEKNLTSGSVLKSILYFSLPYLLSYFLQTLYGMADLFIIGQFEGVASTTAVSIGSQVMHMITVMIVGLAMGTTVTIGRAVGAGNRSHAAKLIGNTVTLFLTGSVVLAAVLVGFVDPIIRLVSVPEEAVAGAKRTSSSALSASHASRLITFWRLFFAGWAIPKARCISLRSPA